MYSLKQAIGQSIFYQVKYRFVMNVFVIAEKYNDSDLKGANEVEKDLEEIFQDLNIDMNIFSYIVPVFSPGPNIKALLAWNDIESCVEPGHQGPRFFSQHVRLSVSG